MNARSAISRGEGRSMTTDLWTRGADEVGAAVAASRSWSKLPPTTQREVSDALAKIARFLEAPGAPTARQLAPDLSSLRAGSGTAPAAPQPGAPSSTAPAPAPANASGGAAPA